jgi:hypothetical protein
VSEWEVRRQGSGCWCEGSTPGRRALECRVTLGVIKRFMLLEESNEEGSLVEQWARLRKREVVFRDSPQGGCVVGLG